VGRVTLAELNRRNYDKRISMGSLAGAGTLGFLVPPSRGFVRADEVALSASRSGRTLSVYWNLAFVEIGD
jgi:TRAP-type mannitol/chloroaromatic compound transport system permease large subunit